MKKLFQNCIIKIFIFKGILIKKTTLNMLLDVCGINHKPLKLNVHHIIEVPPSGINIETSTCTVQSFIISILITSWDQYIGVIKPTFFYLMLNLNYSYNTLYVSIVIFQYRTNIDFFLKFTIYNLSWNLYRIYIRVHNYSCFNIVLTMIPKDGAFLMHRLFISSIFNVNLTTNEKFMNSCLNLEHLHHVLARIYTNWWFSWPFVGIFIWWFLKFVLIANPISTS